VLVAVNAFVNPFTQNEIIQSNEQVSESKVLYISIINMFLLPNFTVLACSIDKQ